MEARARKFAGLQSTIFKDNYAPINAAHRRSYSYDALQESTIENEANGKQSLILNSQKHHYRSKESETIDKEMPSKPSQRHHYDYAKSQVLDGALMQAVNSNKFVRSVSTRTFRKPVLHQETPKKTEFEPKYREESPQVRFSKEFYGVNGSFSVPSSESKLNNLSYRQETGSMNPKERRDFNMASQIFAETKHRRVHSMSCTPDIEEKLEFKPEKRKYEMLDSNIFCNKKYDYPKIQECASENDEAKKKNPLSSNLFGRIFEVQRKGHSRSFSVGEIDKMPINPITGETTQYSNKPVENLKSKPPADFNPHDRHNSSQIHECLMSSQSYGALPKDEPKTAEYSLQGLPKGITSKDLKELCGNMHVVLAQTDSDTVTGYCKGTGKLKIRSSALWEKEMQNIKLTLAEKGISMKPIPPTRRLNSNIFETHRILKSRNTQKKYAPILQNKRNAKIS
ncbi:unnamed protein product [Blepharisma stoltei]|uniref:Uncharacterized protein n=1 Tax=Blepharisma stoltei TaxID=1481888 RepID=A0AAU9IUB9_9CILI|nr:unnamed protein product [Blepharisma stoltei]